MSAADDLHRDFLFSPSTLSDGETLGAFEGTAAPLRHVGAEEPPRPARPMPAAIAIGAFDGVHLGHLRLLQRTVEDARARGIAAVAVTFDPDPDVVVSAAPAPKLLSTADRLRALSMSGVDAVLVVPFTREVAALDHTAFFEGVLAPYLGIRAIHVGSDFRLGARGASTLEVIEAWGRERGVSVTGHHLLLDDGAPVSATRIRSLLGAGELDAAARQLGRRYAVRGEVVHGRGEGAQMGFPTANVKRAPLIQMPAAGVYAGWALTEGGCAYPAAINVGLPPMFKDDLRSATLEATLIGFDGDLYGQELAVRFDARLREPRAFSSRGELISAVMDNMAEVRRLLGDAPVELGEVPR